MLLQIHEWIIQYRAISSKQSVMLLTDSGFICRMVELEKTIIITSHRGVWNPTSEILLCIKQTHWDSASVCHYWLSNTEFYPIWDNVWDQWNKEIFIKGWAEEIQLESEALFVQCCFLWVGGRSVGWEISCAFLRLWILTIRCFFLSILSSVLNQVWAHLAYHPRGLNTSSGWLW